MRTDVLFFPGVVAVSSGYGTSSADGCSLFHVRMEIRNDGYASEAEVEVFVSRRVVSASRPFLTLLTLSCYAREIRQTGRKG